MSKGVCSRVLSEVIHKSAKIPEMLNSRLILRGRSNFTIVNTGWSTKKYNLNFCRNKTIDGDGLKDAFFWGSNFFPQLTFTWLYLLNVSFFPTFLTLGLFYGVQLGWLWFYRWSCCQGGRVVLEILPEVDIVCAVIIIFVIIIFVIFIIDMIFLSMGAVVLEMLPDDRNDLANGSRGDVLIEILPKVEV